MTFNPTLVWFQPQNGLDEQHILSYLSIPLWSDFNIINNLEMSKKWWSFQSHFGLISTIAGEIEQLRLKVLLSIPLWSDFNSPNICNTSSRPCQPFNPTLVWFQPSTFHFWQQEPCLTFNPTLVWFQLNPLEHEIVAVGITFNPTLVWFQLHDLKHEHSVGIQSFNPTLVWFQQFYLKWGTKRDGKTFNPTLVWFQPSSSCLFYFRLYYLSIPLWSDFNSSSSE